jgi:hypothetical protein
MWLLSAFAHWGVTAYGLWFTAAFLAVAFPIGFWIERRWPTS